MIRNRIIRPSYHQGYARSRGESANPGLWKGLVGAWVPALGPTGLTLRDVSGKGNHGTLTNMDPATDWIIGGNPRVPGYALDFGASNAYVQLTGSHNIDVGNSLTLSMWILTRIVTRQTIIGHNNESSAWQLEIHFEEPTAIRVLIPGVFVATALVTSTPTIDTWHHIVYTRSGPGAGTHAIYWNGVPQPLDTSGASNFVDGDTDMELGRRASGSQQFNGLISCFGVYDRPHTPAEVAFAFANPSGFLQLRRQAFGFVAPVGGGPTHPGWISSRGGWF